MPDAIPPAGDSILRNPSLSLAYCWRVARRDGVTFRFTTWSRPLTVETTPGTAETFSPGLAFSASANQQQVGVKADNWEAAGIASIDSEGITDDDLRAGRFRAAVVSEFVVSGNEPWLTPLLRRRFYLQETSLRDDEWRGSLEGITRFLRPKIGQTITRNCGRILGDAGCNQDGHTDTTTTPIRRTGTVATVPGDGRSQFTSAGLASDVNAPDGYFDYGFVTWTSGDNSGLTTDVKAFTSVSGLFELQGFTAAPIQAGDSFVAIAGCNKQKEGDCASKWAADNRVNFLGYSYVPGFDKAFELPNAT